MDIKPLPVFVFIGRMIAVALLTALLFASLAAACYGLRMAREQARDLWRSFTTEERR